MADAPANGPHDAGMVSALPRVRPQPPRPFDADDPGEATPLAGHVDDDAANEDDAPAVEHRAEPAPPQRFDDLAELPGLLEALLFVADHPLEEHYLARALEVSAARIRAALDALGESLREGNRGIRLQRGPEGAQLVSTPEAAPHIERFLGLEANRRLSTASLETLAIIAYRQPITRGQIDTIRGVSSDGAIQTLRARGLIEPAGHAAGPGRPMLLRTTQRFLEHFGLERAGQLPPLPDDVELPAHEISEQLGLDAALVEQALAQASGQPVEEPPAAEDPDVDIPHDVTALATAASHAFSPQAPETDEDDAEPAVS